MYYPSYYYFDPSYLLLILGMIVSMIAQARVRSVTGQYAQVMTRCGLTGAELARQMLNDRTLRLSQAVADARSITALGVAAHETGHAFQHRDAYGPLVLRTAAVSTVNIGSHLSWPLVLLGLIFSWQPLVTAGIVLFCFVVLFTLITLPVEFNASSRALATLEGQAYLDADEMEGARKVLSAAALTYVAAALTAVLQLLRLLAISGRGRRRS